MSSKDLVFLGVLVLFAFSLSFFLGYRVAVSRPVVEHRIDTVTVVRVDTLVVDRPVPVYRRTVDTLLLAVHDTTHVCDSFYIPVPREQVCYEDSAYRAWVSGYHPALDSIRIFAPSKIVTVTERVPVEVSRRWGLGVTAGYGATVDQGSFRLSPYVGVGISYNFIAW